MPPKVTTTEARQGTGPKAMFWVLIISLTLAVIAGLLLGARLDLRALERHPLTPRRRNQIYPARAPFEDGEFDAASPLAVIARSFDCLDACAADVCRRSPRRSPPR